MEQAVAAALISAAILYSVKWLSSADNRESAKQAVQKRLCRHEWEAIPPALITPDREWCRKWRARR